MGLPPDPFGRPRVAAAGRRRRPASGAGRPAAATTPLRGRVRRDLAVAVPLPARHGGKPRLRCPAAPSLGHLPTGQRAGGQAPGARLRRRGRRGRHSRQRLSLPAGPGSAGAAGNAHPRPGRVLAPSPMVRAGLLWAPSRPHAGADPCELAVLSYGGVPLTPLGRGVRAMLRSVPAGGRRGRRASSSTGAGSRGLWRCRCRSIRRRCCGCGKPKRRGAGGSASTRWPVVAAVGSGGSSRPLEEPPPGLCRVRDAPAPAPGLADETWFLAIAARTRYRSARHEAYEAACRAAVARINGPLQAAADRRR